MNRVPGRSPPSSGARGGDQSGTERLALQSMLIVSSGGISYAGGLALNLLLARSLGTRGLGAWVVAFSLATVLSTLGLVGSDWMLMRDGSYYEAIGDSRRLRKVIHLALCLGGAALLVIGAVALFAAAPIASIVFDNPELAPQLRIAALLVPVMGLGQILIFGTRAFKTLKESALIGNILRPFFRIVFSAVALIGWHSVVASLWGLLAAEVATTFTAAVALNRRVPLLGPTEPVRRREILRFALPTWGNRLLTTVREQLFPVMLGSLTSLSGAAIFTTSRRVSGGPTSITNSMSLIYAPLASDFYNTQQREDLSALFKNTGKWGFTLALAPLSFVVAFPAEVLELFGSGFRAGVPVMLILALSVLLNFATGPCMQTLILSGRSAFVLNTSIAAFVLEVLAAIGLAQVFGIVGGAVAYALGSAARNVIALVAVYRYERLHPYRADYWKPVAAAAAGVTVAKLAALAIPFGVVSIKVIALAIITSVAYLIVLLALGLSSEDKEVIESLRSRLRGKRTSPADTTG